ncbi:MAG: alpha/beta hydrolase, partial [bacterium]|nr:alpha/beta hydrolase [bacterium]
ASSQDELPLVVLGGAAAGHKTTKSTIEAFALQYPGRDVYVVSYPDSLAANIPDSFPKKIKGQEGLDVYTRLLKKTIENLGFDKFDLIGISMGGGVSIGAVKDEAFAKKIRNLMIISPTNIQETKSKSALMLQFGSELLHGAFHPREFLRVGQPQNDQELESHKGTGFFSSVDIVRKKAFTPQDLAQLHVNGRILFLAGEKDRIISGRKTLREIEKANINRGEAGKEPIEHCLVLGAHHNLGDAYAAGIVRLIRQTDGSSLPSEYPVSQLENSTAKVLVRENLKLASVADQIT